MTYDIRRDENYQKEWAVTVDRGNGPTLAIPGVRFETEREARLVMEALIDAEAAEPVETNLS